MFLAKRSIWSGIQVLIAVGGFSQIGCGVGGAVGGGGDGGGDVDECAAMGEPCAADADCCDDLVCDEGACQQDAAAMLAAITADFETSIHGARLGKNTFYSADDGFFQLTNVPYDELACLNCHAPTYADGTPVDAATYQPGCADCHADPENPTAQAVTDSVCLGCHGRQGAEQNLFNDVHRDAGMACTGCHTTREMHGDGIMYASFLEEGAMDAACENCHIEGGVATPPDPAITAHAIHGERLDCSACHVESVSTCYNCHFETEVIADVKRFFGQRPRTGFKMLMNFQGQVHTATFQALSYEGQTFLAVAPFFGHSITRQGSDCGDCHLQGGAGNANLAEYQDTGQIVVTRWDDAAEGDERLVGPNGVIPIPQDWMTSLIFDFVDYLGDPTDAVDREANLPLWDYLKTGTDGRHIVYGEPLTDDQMESLMNN